MSKKADLGFRYIILLLMGILTFLFMIIFFSGLGDPIKELLESAFNFHFMW